jgi:hypothetical protein
MKKKKNLFETKQIVIGRLEEPHPMAAPLPTPDIWSPQ